MQPAETAPAEIAEPLPADLAEPEPVRVEPALAQPAEAASAEIAEPAPTPDSELPSAEHEAAPVPAKQDPNDANAY
jgi:hypothetical protein